MSSGCANYPTSPKAVNEANIVSLCAWVALKKTVFFGGPVRDTHGAVGGGITIGSHWAKEVGLERCEVHEIRFPVRRNVSTTTKKRLKKSETCPDVLKQM